MTTPTTGPGSGDGTAGAPGDTWWRRMWNGLAPWQRVAAVLLVAGLLVYGAVNSERSSERTTSSADSSARSACSRFRSFAADAGAGILTPSEMRAQAQEVDDHAQLSDDPAVRNAARDLLAGLTQIDDAAAADAVTRLADACAPYL